MPIVGISIMFFMPIVGISIMDIFAIDEQIVAPGRWPHLSCDMAVGVPDMRRDV
jgi:hypothetical protein